MDSMRSLNSSLPSSRSSQTSPSDLLQAFRTAALSVTHLYKAAAADQANSRQAGYQDALEDLLKFLDEENLGVQDGEGWRIRQWATQRYDGSNYHNCSEADEESEQENKHKSTSCTAAVPTSSSTAAQTKSQSAEVDPIIYNSDTESKLDSTSTPIFQFSGNDVSESHMQTDPVASGQQSSEPSSSSSSSSSAPIRVEVLNRSRSGVKTSNRQSHWTHPKEFTFTAGTKRKLHFPDFFDISSIPDRWDGQGASKKGRHT